jgi:hypothetical protein
MGSASSGNRKGRIGSKNDGPKGVLVRVQNFDEYKPADLSMHQQLIERITRLEDEMREKLGRDVALVAYSHTPGADGAATNAGEGDLGCRVGLDD